MDIARLGKSTLGQILLIALVAVCLSALATNIVDLDSARIVLGPEADELDSSDSDGNDIHVTGEVSWSSGELTTVSCVERVLWIPKLAVTLRYSRGPPT